MAETKISALTALTVPANVDELAIVDKSDTTQAASGSTKKITRADLFNTIVFDASDIAAATQPTTDYSSPLAPTIAGTIASIANAGSAEVVLDAFTAANTDKTLDFTGRVEFRGATVSGVLYVSASWTFDGSGYTVLLDADASDVASGVTAAIDYDDTIGEVPVIRIDNAAGEAIGVSYQAAYSSSDTAVAP